MRIKENITKCINNTYIGTSVIDGSITYYMKKIFSYSLWFNEYIILIYKITYY